MPAPLLGRLSVVCWAVAAGLFAWYVSGVARQITYVTLADGRRQERRLPLIFRLLLPLAPNVAPLFAGPSAARLRDRADAMLASGGYDGLLAASEFLSLKILLPVCLGPFWCLLAHVGLRSSPRLAALALPVALLGLVLLYSWPMLWLRRAIRRRQTAILRSLPFVLDLLTLSVEAGLDFMAALRRCTERPAVDPLTEELLRVVHETQVGASRRDALRSMSARVGLSDLRSVVSALVQADELGVSLGSILRIQSAQVRARRFERAERLANEAPVKLLAPLMLFIFPAVFLILLGPVFHQMLHRL